MAVCLEQQVKSALQISRKELENIQQGKSRITRLHAKLSRLTQVCGCCLNGPFLILIRCLIVVNKYNE